MSFKLNRTKQCSKCPWKVSTNPHEIPDGYDVEKHKALAKTIAHPGDSPLMIRPNMACHHSYEGKEQHCVGWLHNQLGVGNNISLRLNMISCENVNLIKTVGKQHRKFEDTLPKNTQ